MSAEVSPSPIHSHISKVPTGIPGLDHITNGGLPKGRATLIAGSAGTAKTVFATQFLHEGIVQFDQSGVFVSFEENAEDIRRNVLGFGWDIAAHEANGKWAFVDASHHDTEVVFAGQYDLSALLARIDHAVKKVKAQRVVLDSLGAVFAQFSDTTILRRELFRIAAALKQLGVTTILTAERNNEYSEVSRFGVEEFVADNVIVLRNVLADEKRRRTIEILKLRGASHQKGEYPFIVMPNRGIVVIPLSAIGFKQEANNTRSSFGNAELDAMCSGGFFKDSIILVSGATGTGKTVLATHFITTGALLGERTLMFAFEENRDQLIRNVRGWGVDFGHLETAGLLRVQAQYPESAGLEEHLITMQQAIEEFKPTRVVLDSLSAIERITNEKGYREFIIGLTSFIKRHEIAGLYTSTTTALLGGISIAEANISTIADMVILLRYVEITGELRRGLTILKMRGSAHDKDIREFAINEQGIRIGKPFRSVSGIISGNFRRLDVDQFAIPQGSNPSVSGGNSGLAGIGAASGTATTDS